MAQHLVALGAAFDDLEPPPAESPPPTPQEATQIALWQSMLEALWELRELVAEGVKPPKVPAPKVVIDVPSADEVGRAVASSIQLPEPVSTEKLAAALRANQPDLKLMEKLIGGYKESLEEILRRLKKLPQFLATQPALVGNVTLSSKSIEDLSALMIAAGEGGSTLSAVIETSEALVAGNLVNIWNSAGAKARKATAQVAGKEAHGFVTAAFDSGVAATVYFEGINDQMAGLTPGQQFLSITPGAATAVAPTGSGNVVQRVGVAFSGTALSFEADAPIVLA